jgi:hypothetical protein
VHPLVGDIARPSLKMRLECRPAVEAAAGDRILLDVADAALVFPLLSHGQLPVIWTVERP